jgi:hypothetical protein
VVAGGADARSRRGPEGPSTFSQLSGLSGRLAADTGDYCLKARRIPLGLLYVAVLILIVTTIPLAKFAPRQPINHRQSTAFSVRLNQMKM